MTRPRKEEALPGHGNLGLTFQAAEVAHAKHLILSSASGQATRAPADIEIRANEMLYIGKQARDVV